MVKIYKNLEFGQNFRKIQILIKIVGNSRFWSKLTKMSISDKTAKNLLIIVKIFEKFRFVSIFMKISILVKIHEDLDFGQNCRKILILDNIFVKSQF